MLAIRWTLVYDVKIVYEFLFNQAGLGMTRFVSFCSKTTMV